MPARLDAREHVVEIERAHRDGIPKIECGARHVGKPPRWQQVGRGFHHRGAAVLDGVLHADTACSEREREAEPVGERERLEHRAFGPAVQQGDEPRSVRAGRRRLVPPRLEMGRPCS
jgi:hypothetical protein